MHTDASIPTAKVSIGQACALLTALGLQGLTPEVVMTQVCVFDNSAFFAQVFRQGKHNLVGETSAPLWRALHDLLILQATGFDRAACTTACLDGLWRDSEEPAREVFVVSELRRQGYPEGLLPCSTSPRLSLMALTWLIMRSRAFAFARQPPTAAHDLPRPPERGSSFVADSGDDVVVAMRKLDLLLKECHLQHKRYAELLYRPVDVESECEPWEEVFWHWMESVVAAHQLSIAGRTAGGAECGATLEEVQMLEAEVQRVLSWHTREAQTVMKKLTVSMGSGAASSALREVKEPIAKAFAEIDHALQSNPGSTHGVIGVSDEAVDRHVANLTEEYTAQLRELQSEAKRTLDGIVDAVGAAGAYRIVH